MGWVGLSYLARRWLRVREVEVMGLVIAVAIIAIVCVTIYQMFEVIDPEV